MDLHLSSEELFTELGLFSEHVILKPFVSKLSNTSDEPDLKRPKNEENAINNLFEEVQNIDKRSIFDFGQEKPNSETEIDQKISGTEEKTHISDKINLQKGSLQFVQSSKSNGQLVHNGFIFNKEKTENDITRWKCIKYRKFKCKGRVHTSGTQVIYDNDSHNHTAQESDLKARIVTCNIKEMALYSIETKSEVITHSTDSKPIILNNISVNYNQI